MMHKPFKGGEHLYNAIGRKTKQKNTIWILPKIINANGEIHEGSPVMHA